MKEKLTVGELVYKISGDVKDLDVKLSKSEKELKKIQAQMVKTEKTSSKMAKGFGLLKTAVVGFISGALVRGVTQLAKAGAELDSLDQSFEKLTANLGINSDEALRELKKFSGGTISTKDIILSANRAMVLGVAKNTEEFGTLMQIARLRARDLGLTTTQAFNDIVTGIGRSSPLILDNLGIVIKQNEAYDVYAKELGKTADALTDNEKREALKFAVLKQGREEVARAGEVTLTYSEQMQKLSATVTDLKNEFGRALLPTISSVLKEFDLMDVSTEESQKKFNTLSKTIFQVTNFLIGMGKAVVLVIQGITGVTDVVGGAVKDSITGTVSTVKKLATGKFKEAWEQMTQTSEEGGEKIVSKTEAWAQVLQEQFDSIGESAVKAIDAEGFEPVAKSSDETFSQIAGDAQSAADAIGDAGEDAQETLEDMQEKMISLAETSREASKALKEDFTDAIKETNKGLAEIVIGAENTIKDLKKQIREEDDADRKKALREELKDQEEILKAKEGFEERQAERIEAIRERLSSAGIENDELDNLLDVQTLEEQIAEERRLASLDEFTRFEEQQTAKIERIVDDIVTRRELENELTSFLQSQDATRLESVKSFANGAIAKYQEMAASLRTAISLQQRLNALRSGGGLRQFHTGGFVGPEGGEVHAGEYVIPANLVGTLRSTVAGLESARTGGSSNITNNRNVSAPVTVNANVSDQVDVRAIGRELAWQIERR